ncbi:hypothetical protein HK097_005463, partial [Rhizophlyctis rosea]
MSKDMLAGSRSLPRSTLKQSDKRQKPPKTKKSINALVIVSGVLSTPSVPKFFDSIKIHLQPARHDKPIKPRSLSPARRAQSMCMLPGAGGIAALAEKNAIGVGGAAKKAPTRGSGFLGDAPTSGPGMMAGARVGPDEIRASNDIRLSTTEKQPTGVMLTTDNEAMHRPPPPRTDSTSHIAPTQTHATNSLPPTTTTLFSPTPPPTTPQLPKEDEDSSSDLDFDAEF